MISSTVKLANKLNRTSPPEGSRRYDRHSRKETEAPAIARSKNAMPTSM